MAGEDINIEVLGYLKEKGSTNTFRLASVMGMDRAKLLSLLKKLEEKGAIRFEHGNAVFIKFVSEEKTEKPKSKPIEIKISSSHPECEVKRKEHQVKRKSAKSKALQLLQIENKQFQRKVVQLGETIKELERKASAAPKTITKTITKTIIRKVPVTKTIIKKIPVPCAPPLSRKKGKFEFPKLSFLKNIKKLKKPEFIK